MRKLCPTYERTKIYYQDLVSTIFVRIAQDMYFNVICLPISDIILVSYSRIDWS